MSIFGDGVWTDDLLVKPVFGLMIFVVKPVFGLMKGGVWTETWHPSTLVPQHFPDGLKCSNKCY